MDFSSQIIERREKSVNLNNNQDKLIPKLTSLELGYILLCLCIYLFWALTFTSISYGPDEYMRYPVPYYIYENNALPTGPEEAIRNSIWGSSYGFDMTASYIIAAFLIKIMSWFTTNSNMLLVAARLECVIASVGMTYFSILLSKRVMKDRPIRWVFIVLMSLHPQIVFLSSYFNLDSYSLFTVVMIVYAWKACLDREWDTKSTILLAVGLGLCLLGYQFSYGYVMATFFLYISWHLLNWKRRSFSQFISTGLVILAVVFAICGWRYIRNAMLYNGDFLALHASEPYAEQYAMEEFKPSVRHSLAEDGMSITGMLTQTPWIPSTIKSLIGVFGYMNIFLPDYMYTAYGVLVAVGLAGLVLKGIGAVFGKFEHKDKRGKNANLIGVWMLFASMIVVGLSAYFSWHSDYQPQGRYIISVIPCLFLMVTEGYKQWTEVFGSLSSDNAAVVNWLGTVCSRMVLIFLLFCVFCAYVLCLNAFVTNV